MTVRHAAALLAVSLALVCMVLPGAGGAAARVTFTAIADGSDHFCAVTSGGGVMCLGTNTSGELGDGTHRGREFNLATPISVKHLPARVMQVAAGSGHSCAVTVAGGVYCWGRNVSGQLGNGTTKSSNRPVAVVGLGARVKSIVAGDFHTCVITTAGAVKCWGSNQNGQLGVSGGNRTKPVDVPFFAGAVALSATLGESGNSAPEGTCALTVAGAVRCAGVYATQSGSLPGLESGVSSMTAKYYGICAVIGGTVRCSGNGPNGLADVRGLKGPAKAVDGYCALMASGAEECWNVGPPPTRQTTAMVIPGLASGVRAIAGQTKSAGCSLMTSGAIKCWTTYTHGKARDVFAPLKR